MKNGRCLKCNAENVYSYYFPVLFFNQSFFKSYICCDCGYLEKYINENDSKLIEGIKLKGIKIVVKK